MLHLSLCHAGVDGELEEGSHAALAGSRFGDLLTDIAPGLGWGLAVAWSPTGERGTGHAEYNMESPRACHDFFGFNCAGSGLI